MEAVENRWISVKHGSVEIEMGIKSGWVLRAAGGYSKKVPGITGKNACVGLKMGDSCRKQGIGSKLVVSMDNMGRKNGWVAVEKGGKVPTRGGFVVNLFSSTIFLISGTKNLASGLDSCLKTLQ